MELEKAIELLRERVEIDRYLRDGKVEGDYDRFCENECIAIETCLGKLYEYEMAMNGVRNVRDKIAKDFRYNSMRVIVQDLTNILGE